MVIELPIYRSIAATVNHGIIYPTETMTRLFGDSNNNNTNSLHIAITRGSDLIVWPIAITTLIVQSTIDRSMYTKYVVTKNAISSGTLCRSYDNIITGFSLHSNSTIFYLWTPTYSNCLVVFLISAHLHTIIYTRYTICGLGLKSRWQWLIVLNIPI